MRKPPPSFFFCCFIFHLLQNKGHPICKKCVKTLVRWLPQLGFGFYRGRSLALALCPAAENEEGRGERVKQVYYRPFVFLYRKRNVNTAY